ncbi:unnamed protein product, partial [Timema podura]|nr:unnamed protein product [Timema podura]
MFIWLRATLVRSCIRIDMKMRYLKSYITLVLRVVLPIFVTAYYVWLRNQRSVVNGVRRQLFPAILAAITSSVTLTTLSGQWRRPRSLCAVCHVTTPTRHPIQER